MSDEEEAVSLMVIEFGRTDDERSCPLVWEDEHETEFGEDDEVVDEVER